MIQMQMGINLKILLKQLNGQLITVPILSIILVVALIF
jgi:hypothetical protein